MRNTDERTRRLKEHFGVLEPRAWLKRREGRHSSFQEKGPTIRRCCCDVVDTWLAQSEEKKLIRPYKGGKFNETGLSSPPA